MLTRRIRNLYLSVLAIMLLAAPQVYADNVSLAARIKAVTCSVNILFPGPEKQLVWRVGLVHDSTDRTAITDAEASLGRRFDIAFGNPQGEEGLAECSMARNGVRLSIKAGQLNTENQQDCPFAGNGVFCGAIAQAIEPGRFFLYYVTFLPADITPPLGADVQLLLPAGAPVVQGAVVLPLSGNAAGELTVQRAPHNTQESISLGRYPFVVRLVKYYNTPHFAPSPQSAGSQNVGVLTVTATYL